MNRIRFETLHCREENILRIIVCVKSAIDVSQIKTDRATGQLIIDNVPRKLNDFDKNALEEAVRLKEKFGGEVLAVTIGPESTKTIIREVLAIGADKAYIINDPVFEGSDTLATSYILAEVVKKIGKYDLILCGEASIDSYTAQIGPRLAERLNIPVVTYARKISFEGNVVTVERTLEDCYHIVKVNTPALLTVTKELNEPRIPTLMSIMKASKKEVITWTSADIGISNEKVGSNGSATKVMSVFAPKMERKKIIIMADSPEKAAESLAITLLKEGIVKK